MNKYLLPALLLLASLSACEPPAAGSKQDFIPVDTNFRNQALLLPKGNLKHTVLFSKGDMVKAPGGELAPARGKHDFLAFLPLGEDPNHGILWTNHESLNLNDALGDGGGATVMEVMRDSVEGWKVIGIPHAVDFKPVGGTVGNCLGAVTPWGTVLTSEEYEPMKNMHLYRDSTRQIFRDTTDYDSLPRWKNYGWMVEVDAHNHKALRKLHAMGRFMHEGNYCMADKRTVYMMDDDAPGAFFKFVADKPGDYSQGQLSAFQLQPDGTSGKWLDLPRDLDSLVYARDMAHKRGATVFIRMEDLELAEDGTFIITETGKDSIDLSHATNLGGQMAPWLEKYHLGDSIYDDTYGRLLRFDPKANTLKVLMEGGQASEDKSIVLSNPDNLALDLKRNRLIIHEDINDKTGGRNPEGSKFWVNEIYMLDLSIVQPGLDDLKRVAVIPHGAESTGGIWSPDFQTLFFNIQHPSSENPAPFNKDATVAITGWGE